MKIFKLTWAYVMPLRFSAGEAFLPIKTKICSHESKRNTSWNIKDVSSHQLCLLSCFFGRLLIFFQNQLFQKILSGILSECQTVWILIRPDVLSGLIWVQTVCTSCQQTTLVVKELKLLIHVSFFKNVSEYDQEIAQSHAADQPTAPWGRATKQ